MGWRNSIDGWLVPHIKLLLSNAKTRSAEHESETNIVESLHDSEPNIVGSIHESETNIVDSLHESEMNRVWQKAFKVICKRKLLKAMGALPQVDNIPCRMTAVHLIEPDISN